MQNIIDDEKGTYFNYILFSTVETLFTECFLNNNVNTLIYFYNIIKLN